MYDFKPNLEPGNPDGHTVLRYLVESRQMPLESAIECVYQAVSKFASQYRSDQGKLIGGMMVTGVLGLPVFFPFGVSSLLIAGAIAGSAFRWQELGTMRERLKPEYAALKGSVLLEQFIKWLAQQLRERREDLTSGQFQPDAITTANIIAAYEHTIFAITNGEHLENNASDPILALFVLKLRQHTNHLPDWVMSAFRQLEQAEVQRATDVDRASRYMWGNLDERYPQAPQPSTQAVAPKIGYNTRLEAVPVPAMPVEPQQEGEQRLGKQPLALTGTKTLPPFDRDRIINESKGLMIIGDMGAAKTCVAQYIANGFEGYGIIVFDPHAKTDWGNAYVITKMGAIYQQMAILLDLLEHGDETPLLIICDEWLEIRGDRRNKKGSESAGLADDFIRLFSTKPRKFNKLAAFVLHSPNVEAAGVDSFLRENYLKVYLGRLAKKDFPNIQDCAYPCVVEDEQQEHPTHGHHAEFKPKDKPPRNLQPLSSAPINIPLAYMEGGRVKVCDRGWADGQLRLNVANIRNQLEMLYRDTSIDTDTSYQTEEIKGDTDDTRTDTSDTSIDTGNDTDATETPEPIANTSGSSGIDQIPEPGIDTKRYTPANLTKEQILILIYRMQCHMSQTQVIQDLWAVEKNKAGWKQAYAEYKELMGE
ncbi:MAG TPA: hypothetical protein V6D11_14935 [Waterburya sp.]|jgi:hypothetical protein